MNTISSKSEANQNNTKSDIPVTLMAILKRPSFVEVNIKGSDYFVETLIWE